MFALAFYASSCIGKGSKQGIPPSKSFLEYLADMEEVDGKLVDPLDMLEQPDLAKNEPDKQSSLDNSAAESSVKDSSGVALKKGAKTAVSISENQTKEELK